MQSWRGGRSSWALDGQPWNQRGPTLCRRRCEEPRGGWAAPWRPVFLKPVGKPCAMKVTANGGVQGELGNTSDAPSEPAAENSD